jgi:hypothetical protein
MNQGNLGDLSNLDTQTLLQHLPGVRFPAEEVQAQILKKRRERVLPDQADLQRISRYEAHLSRQMYQALHELEALQTRRGGKAAPLARLDVQS